MMHFFLLSYLWIALKASSISHDYENDDSKMLANTKSNSINIRRVFEENSVKFKSASVCIKQCHCFTDKLSGFQVDCSNQNFSNIPVNIPVETTKLYLDRNKLENIPSYAFKHLVNLKTLNISNNNIRRIEEGAFSGLKRLTILWLTYNFLESNDSIAADAFLPLKDLQELHIYGNCNSVKISCDYHENPISKISSLKLLSMDGIERGTFGPGFAKLKKLRSLLFRYGYCRIPSITVDTFQYFSETPLQWLALDLCPIMNIQPFSFSSLKYLNTLEIADNLALCNFGFQNLTIGLELTSIKKLELTHNCKGRTIMFRNGVYMDLSYTRLEYLNMQSCRIAYLSVQTLTHLPLTLKYLILKDNQLVSSPMFLLFLPIFENLLYLDISLQNWFTENLKFQHNDQLHQRYSHLNPWIQKPISSTSDSESSKYTHEVERIDVKFKHIPFPNPVVLPQSLTFLNMSFLKMPEYPIAAFNVSTKNVLETVDASNNMLGSSTGCIRGLHYLKVLNISVNRIIFVHPETFADMVNLTFLNLSQNEIGRNMLHKNTFMIQENLEYLDLSLNAIKILPYDLFSPLTKLSHLFLNNNSMTDVRLDLTELYNLRVLDLSYNQITDIPAMVRSALDNIALRSPIRLYLYGNNLKCTCEQQKFVEWMATTKVHVLNISSLKCQYLNDTFISMSNLDDIKFSLSMECIGWKVLTGAVTTFVCLLLILSFLAVLYQQRWKIKYLYYLSRRNINPYHPLEEENIQMQTDAYLSYCDANNEFDQMVKRVYHALCNRGLHIKIREEILGNASLHGAITEVIRHTNKVVVFLTKNYCQDYWNTFEFNMAACEGIYTKRNIIVPILVGNMQIEDMSSEIRIYLKDENIIKLKDGSNFNEFIDVIERRIHN